MQLLPTQKSPLSNFRLPRLTAIFAAILALFFVAAINDARAQQDIYWRGDTGSTVWWNDSDKPWYYATWTSTEIRPDYYPVPTRNRLNFDNNNQTTTTVNGATFEILSLRIHNNSTGRTFNNSSGGKINVSVGITNDVAYGHTFNVDIDLGGSTVNFTGNTGNNMTFNNAIGLGGNKALFGGSSSTASFTINGLASGSGGQIELNNGFLVLANSGNSYTGATTVNGGTLEVTANNGLGTTAGGTTVASGATLDFKNVNYSTAEGVTLNGGTVATTTGSSTFAGGVTLGANSIYNVTGTQLTQSGVITDGASSFSLTKNGGGILLLSASGGNTYDGATTINAGTVAVSQNNALGSTSGATTLASGATLDFQNINYSTAEGVTANGGTIAASTGTSTFAGAITLGASSSFSVGSGAQLTQSGAIGDGVSSFTITKTGSGVLVLTADNTYDGGTIINAGTVSIGKDLALGSAPGSVDADNIAFGGGTLAISAGFTLGSNRGITLNTGGGTIDVASSQTLSYGGVITGANSLAKTGSGALVLTGNSASSYNGTTTLSAGTLRVGHNSALGTGGLTLGGGTFAAEGSTARSLANALTISGDVTFGETSVNTGALTFSQSVGLGSGTRQLTVNQNTTFSGAVSSGNITKAGSAQLSFGNASTSFGTLTVNAGTAAFTESAAITGLTGSGTVDITSGKTLALTIGSNFTFGGTLAGGGTLTKAGSTDFFLTGASSSYTGAININAGVLEAQNSSALGTSAGGVTVADTASFKLYNASTDLTFGDAFNINGVGVGSGAILSTGGNNTINGNITLSGNARLGVNDSGRAGSLTLAGNIAAGGNTLYVGGNQNITLSGNLSGTKTTGDFALFIDGSANTTVSGADNSGLTGTVRLTNSGTLLLGSANALGSGDWYISPTTAPTIASTNSTARSIGNATTYIYTSLTLGQSSGGTGSLTFGAVNLGADASGSHQRTITAAANTSHTFGAVAGGAANTLIKAGNGTLTLSAAGTTTGGVRLDAGTLRVGNDSALGTGALTINGGTFSSSSATSRTIANDITMGGNVTFGEASTGTLSLGGTFNLGGASRTITTTVDTTIGGQVSNGDLTKQGSSSLTLSSGSSSFGTLTLASGALAINGDTTVTGLNDSGGGAMSILSAKTLTVNNSAEFVFSRQISGGGALTKSGAGKFILSGSNSYSGLTTVGGSGEFEIQNADALGSTNAGTTVSSGAALALWTGTSGLTFAAEALTLSGTGVSSGGALRNVDKANTWSGAITLGSASRINSTAGTLTLDVASGDAISANNFGLTFGGAGNVVVNDPIATGSGTLTKDGAGTLTLAGNNTYSGATTISEGAVRATHNNAFGATAGGVTVAANAALQLSGGVTIGNEALGLSGAGINSGGALQSVSGSNNYDGLITLTGAYTYLGAASGATLRVAAVNADANEFWVVGDGTTILSGGATNSASGTAFVKVNTGTAVLAASNAWSGAEFIREGTVILSNNHGLGVGGTTTLGSSSGSATATLTLGSNITNSNAINVETNGTGVRTLGYQTASGTGAQLGSVSLQNSSLAFNVASGGTLLFGGGVSAWTGPNETNRLALDGGGTLIITNDGTGIAGTDKYQVRIGNGTMIIGAGTIIARTNTSGLGHSIDLGLDLNGGAVSQTSSLLASNNVTVSNSIYVSTASSAARNLGLSGTGAATFSGRIDLNNAGINLTAGANGSVTFSGVIADANGANAVTKTGAGTVTLSGDNSFGGVLTVSEGKLTINTINNASANGVLGNSANAVVLGSGGQTGFLHYTGGAASSSKKFTAASGGTAGIEVSSAATTLTLSGEIGGSGGVQKGGAGALLLSGNNTFTGALNVHDGTLEIASINNASANGVLGNSATAVGLGKSGTANTATLLYSGATASSTKAFSLNSDTNAAGVINVSGSTAALTLSGEITGVGRFEKAGSGTLILSASNNYSGGTTLSAGVLQLNSIYAAGAGKITQSSGSSTLQINATGTLANQMSIYNIRTMQNVTLSGAKTLNNATYTVDANTTTTDSGDLSGTGGVTKQGTGTLILTGNNTYTGAVAVNAGLLNLNSSAGGAAASTTTVSVASGATLLISQNNQVNNSATVSLSGGTIRTAAGVSEVFGNLTVTGSGFLDFGTTSYANANTISFGTYTPSALLTIDNFNFGSTLTFKSDLSGSINDLSKFSFSNGGISSYSWNSGTSTFTITAIPEPSTYIAAAGLLAMFLWPPRRRLIKDMKSILGLRAPARDRLAR